MPMFRPRSLLRAGIFTLCASASLVAGAASDTQEDASALDRPLPEIRAAGTDADIDESQFSTDVAPPPLDPDYRQPAANQPAP